MKFIKNIFTSVVALAALPVTALAQQVYYGGQGGFGVGNNPFGFNQGGFNQFGQTRPATIGSFDSIMLVAQRLLGYGQVIIFVTALFYLLFAAFKFAKGDAKDAPTMIMNAILGILLALLAFTIIPMVCWLTQSGGPACMI